MEMTGSSQVMTGWIVACSTSTASAADVIYGAIATPCSLMRPSGTCSNPVIDFFIPGLAADPAQPGHLSLVYAYFHAGSKTLGIGVAQTRDGKSWSVRRLDPQAMPTTWLPRAEGGRMVGDYFSVSYAADRIVPVFALARAPLKGRLREGIFGTSLPALK